MRDLITKTKINFRKTVLIATVIFGLISVPLIGYATSYDSTNFNSKNPVIDEGSPTSSSSSFKLNQSIGQPGIGKSSSTNFQLWSGFQYYYTVLANTLTATPGDSQVSLSWTTPQTFLGVSVSSYELGTGTSSGIYTFEAVGSGNNYTKTGLTNDTAYYFVVKALTSGGTFLVFSNEATSTPTASSSGGGGGPISSSSLSLSGYSIPGGTVHVLSNASEVGQAGVNGDGTFNLNLNNLPIGKNNISVFAVDPTGRPTAWYNKSINLNPGKASSLTDILTPPSLSTSPQVIQVGEAASISGYSQPNADIKIIIKIAGKETVLTTKSDGSGKFSQNVPSTQVSGAYSITAYATYLGLQSPSSLIATLWVGVQPPVTPPPIGGVIACGDYNLDGHINIIDFSILIFWFGKPNPPARIDCIKDNKADLFDFSYLMYYWTG